MDKHAFGRKVKMVRNNRKMTAESLAEALGLSEKSIWQVEAGRRGVSLPVLIDMCNVMKVSPDLLLFKDLNESNNGSKNDYLYTQILVLNLEEVRFIRYVIKLLPIHQILN